MKLQIKTSSPFVPIIWLAAIIFGCAGYVLNIVKLVQATGITGLELFRVCGVFVPPLGAIVGYF